MLQHRWTTEYFENAEKTQQTGMIQAEEDHVLWVMTDAFSETPIRWSQASEKIREEYGKSYEAYKKGQELPVEGFPLKMWSLMPNGLAEVFVRAGLRTVEELASASDAHAQRVMRFYEWRDKAKAMVETANKAKVAQELDELRKQIDELKNPSLHVKSAKPSPASPSPRSSV